MGDDRSTNAIPTGVWVRRELVDALREALPDSYRPGMYVALHDAARAVVDAVETEVAVPDELTTLREGLAAERRRKEFWKANYHTPVADLATLRQRIRALADETPHKTTDHLGNVTGYLIPADELNALLGDV